MTYGFSYQYDEEIADELCERVAAGETLRKVCMYDDIGFERERGTFPRPNTVYQWCRSGSHTYNPDFCVRFAQAQLDQQRMWIEEVIDISNTVEWGEETTHEDVDSDNPEKGPSTRNLKRVVRKEMLGHRQLKIDTRLKALKMLNPDLWDAKKNKAEDDGTTTIVVHGGLFD